jgi:hypothetical protein
MNAQSWCPPGARWVYDVGNPWSVAQEQLTYAGDTIVDGHVSQRIDRLFRMVQPMNVTTNWAPIFTRTDGDVVWEWDGTNWDTLYWFSAVPGDHWQPLWPYEESCPDHAWLVLDTSTTWVDAIPLRTLLLDITMQGAPAGQPFTIHERTGGGGGFGFPGLPPCGAIYECFCTFICYQDQDINSMNTPCEITLALPPDIQSVDVLPIHPQPADQQVTIDLPVGATVDLIEVMSLDGRILLNRVEHANGPFLLNTNSLPTGLHVIHLHMADGVRYYGRLMISH